MKTYSDLLTEIKTLLTSSFPDATRGLREICELLQKELKNYDWVGFYFSDFKTKTLHLRAFAGVPTEHTEIPFGKGICGQVAVSNSNFVVPDVKAQDNYISCGIDIKSEIVIPIFIEGKNIGQIDVDSHSLNTFTPEDEAFLESVCQLITKTYTTIEMIS